ncbi:hypothetical protein [Bartonella sp. MR90HLJMH]|uniref:hypothetical protein n=1 Tax=Bartonella sp. MR90HLJMH TaxID=3243559 RepID=UPI0035CF68E2
MQAVLNWIEQHPVLFSAFSVLFSALSSVGALLSAIFAFRSIKQTLKLRKEDKIEAEKLRKEDLEKFKAELANAMNIAKSTKQQAQALEKLTNVLEKQTEILEQRKLNVLSQYMRTYKDPDSDVFLFIDIALFIANPTKQPITINSISINKDSLFRFIHATYSISYPFPPYKKVHTISPKNFKLLCFKKPKVEPKIYDTLNVFSLDVSGSLYLVLTIVPINNNTPSRLTFTLEHTAVDPQNPPEKVNFPVRDIQYFEPEPELLQLLRSKNNGFPI